MTQLRSILTPCVVVIEWEGARVSAFFSDRFRDDRSRRYFDLICDLEMPQDDCPTADATVTSYVGAARDADAARDSGMRTDTHVMGDLYLIV